MASLDSFSARFPGVPPAVVLKIDLLRCGVRFGERSVGTRHFHHHDEPGQKPVDPRAHLQGSIVLPGGTPVFISHNPSSPYEIYVDDDGDTVLGDSTSPLAVVTPGPAFGWARARTSSGAPMASVFTPSLGGGCGPVALFLLRHCEFAASGEECRFCSWVRMGKSSEMRPNVIDMRETLDAIWREQGTIGYLAFSGGSLFNRTKEADAFVMYMDAVRQTGLPLPPTVAAIQALDEPDTRRLAAAGFDYVCYSMEVWDEQAWVEVLPGKQRSVGRDRWMACLEAAVDVFGPGRVLCNFVAGVETITPDRYDTPEQAADDTLDGMRWCCERGIYPKYAVWIPSAGAAYGRRQPPPLDYYVRVAVGRQQLFAEYPMAVPEIDCGRCLTQSCEADLARLDPGRFAVGPAAIDWLARHPLASIENAAGISC